MADVVPHNRLTFGDEETAAVAAVVASGYWAGGPRVAELEQALAHAFGKPDAACVASGLSALRLALAALGVGPGDEVLVPAYACVAIPNAVAALGATPVAGEIEPRTWTLAPTDARYAVAVHTFGAPADVAAFTGTLIDDAAHGLPAGIPPTAATITSFYATKLIGGAEGGAVLGDLADAVRDARDYTDKPASALRLNDKMNDLEAALTLAQLRRLPDLLAARERLARRYGERLAHLKTIALPAEASGRVWYRYAVEAQHTTARELAAHLREHGVIAHEPVEDWRSPEQREATPIATRAYERLLSLPLYPTLTDAEQDRVIAALEAA
ncbi:DegT/DnrJ/EryC1/StrS aminotransferase family protein [Solirubrobacter phytolaccae]|uniref:DegT/DnrJ/EryC1/StrS aminotransferase family protein n=1 Tax=Solirubrobacter phytolaccae TaxID=1404360 RepID=A0A9X3NG95_9ACTN|nr:DegT/DnrJ/EryC1/StrS aminotransferase family protein [Solirubrobacter phytolaccae]MDA0183506.1 DegT/DnrJ/EryC1/StrS aminotransferase family protein [Solirubrobacter phytolaccae]